MAMMSRELEDKKRMLDVFHQHKESQNTLEDNKQTNISKDYYHNIIYKCTNYVDIIIHIIMTYINYIAASHT